MKLFMRFFIIIIVLALTFSCKKERGASSNAVNQVLIDSVTITKGEVAQIKFLDYRVIGSKAENTLDSWQAYNTVATAIAEIKIGEFKFFKTDDEEFNTMLNDLGDTLPFAINSDPIKARLLVLKTKLLKLREAVSLKTIRKQEQLMAIKELFQSFSYLIFQINKKFEKESQNIIKPQAIRRF